MTKRIVVTPQAKQEPINWNIRQEATPARKKHVIVWVIITLLLFLAVLFYPARLRGAIKIMRSFGLWEKTKALAARSFCFIIGVFSMAIALIAWLLISPFLLLRLVWRKIKAIKWKEFIGTKKGLAFSVFAFLSIAGLTLYLTKPAPPLPLIVMGKQPPQLDSTAKPPQAMDSIAQTEPIPTQEEQLNAMAVALQQLVHEADSSFNYSVNHSSKISLEEHFQRQYMAQTLMCAEDSLMGGVLLREGAGTVDSLAAKYAVPAIIKLLAHKEQQVDGTEGAEKKQLQNQLFALQAIKVAAEQGRVRTLPRP